MEHVIHTPASSKQLAALRAGDRVLLSGTVYTARDAAHKRLTELLDSSGALPFSIENCAIYYVGPTPEKPGEIIGSAGPTTSGRMDAYSPRLLDKGETIMIGKGNRSAAVISAMKRSGAVYLAAMGGAGALMAGCVKASKIICWEDLGCEAVRELLVEDMPLTVAIDSQGGNIYELGPAAYLESLKGGR